jgi:acyl carrier protein
MCSRVGAQAIQTRLIELLAHHSGAPAASLSLESTPQNTPGWDSVANLGLLAAVEDEFNVTFATRDAIKLRSLGDIAAYLEAREAAG